MRGPGRRRIISWLMSLPGSLYVGWAVIFGVCFLAALALVEVLK